jgi:hypothetical protein
MPDRPIELADASTVACLGDGWHAAMCIDANGQSWPWLLAPDITETSGGNGCRRICCAPHDQAGPLPATIRSRINRCQHTRRGWQCSRAAPLGEDRCWQHQAMAGHAP